MEKQKRKYPDIPAYGKREYYPLSFQQERILYLSRLLPENTYWNRVSTKQLKGTINLQMLKEALKKLAEHHSVLKTRIQILENKPVQSCTAWREQSFEFIDFIATANEGNEGQAKEIVYEHCRKPIDVNGDELFKTILIRYAENEYFLILKLHHIITDATSFHILWRDLKFFYNSLCGSSRAYNVASGDAEALPTPGITYFDYALWQREVFCEENLREQEAYWMNEFSGDIPVLDLPADFPPQKQISFRGALETITLPAVLVKDLQALSLKKRVILFSTLLSVYFILLRKYCGQEKMVAGTVFSGRQYNSDIKSMAGFFINTIAILMDVTDDMAVDELLLEAHKKIDEAYFMQDYPFEKIIQKINAGQDTQLPLFRTIFNMVNHYGESRGFEGVEEENLISPEVNAAQIEILMEVHNYNNRDLEVRIEYNTAIFSSETIKNLLEHYVHLLSCVVQKPDAAIRELELVPDSRQKRFLAAWNDTSRANPEGKTLHGLFDEQVERTPAAVAVISEDEQITYRELNERANRMAAYLRDKGASPNQLIGVVLDRTIDMVVSVLGVLKSGAAYLPAESAYPADRIGYILKNSKASMVITQSKHEHVTELGVPVVDIDEVNRADHSSVNLTPVGSDSDLAYTIYTSGSTGKPKGVMIRHCAAVNTILDINRRFALGTEDRILGLSSLSFDLSVYDIFGSLMAGAALVQNRDQRNMREILTLLEDQKITIWNSVPAIMDILLENVKSSFTDNNLRLVLLSGDWIPLHLPVKIRKHFPNAEIISLGGATEASIWSIYYPVKEIKESWSSIPYGNPLANQTFYVLDKAGKLCPVGIRGELYIGGKGLASGYINDPEKTSEAFIDHPEFGPLYRTGDWGKFHRKGYIEFLGRKDQQVKIRGYRIELGEIEKTLLSLAEVREAVVVVREDTPGNRKLVAYLVLNSPQNRVEEETLRGYLEKWLPFYMIPAAYVTLEAFPLSANGKVDLRGLPAPDEKTESADKYKAPETEVEKKLVEISEAILNVKPIGLNDNFFKIGGNSLLTIRFISEIEEAFGIQFTMLDFINLPVISEIVKKIELLRPAGEGEDEFLEEQLAYWKEQMMDAPPLQALPLDRSRPAVQEFQIGKEFFNIPQDLADQLKKLGRQLYVSLPMILSTAFMLLLWYKSKQEDLVTGLPIMNGDEDEQRVGCDNVLPLRISLSDNPSFQELLTRVRAGTLDAYANQDLSFEMLLKELKIAAGTDCFPLFQSVFAFQNEPGSLMEDLERLTENSVKPDLVLSVIDSGQDLCGCWEYNNCLFDDGTIRQLMDLYGRLLEWINCNTDKNLSELKIEV